MVFKNPIIFLQFFYWIFFDSPVFPWKMSNGRVESSCRGSIMASVYDSRVFGVGGQVGTSGEQRTYSNTFN